jgi:hypothetical protein
MMYTVHIYCQLTQPLKVMKHNQNVLCVDLTFEKPDYMIQYTGQERKTFQKRFWFKQNCPLTQKDGSRSRQNGNPYLSKF